MADVMNPKIVSYFWKFFKELSPPSKNKVLRILFLNVNKSRDICVIVHITVIHKAKLHFFSSEKSKMKFNTSKNQKTKSNTVRFQQV